MNGYRVGVSKMLVCQGYRPYVLSHLHLAPRIYCSNSFGYITMNEDNASNAMGRSLHKCSYDVIRIGMQVLHQQMGIAFL